jgi:hypothetical protein
MPGREDAVYIGDGTASGAHLRNLKLAAALRGTALERLGALVTVLFGGQVKYLPGYLEEGKAWGMGTLAALGFDPETHTLARKNGACPGWVVRDAGGQPVRGISDKQLARLTRDPAFLEAFSAASGIDSETIP